MNEIGVLSSNPTMIFEDNQACIQIGTGVKFSTKTKHVDIRYNICKDWIERKYFQLEYCPTEIMYADMYTKGVSVEKLKEFVKQLGMIDMKSFIPRRSVGISGMNYCDHSINRQHHELVGVEVNGLADWQATQL
jgi:hypothetical protein